MEPLVKQSVKVAKILPFSPPSTPLLQASTKSFFCTISSTGDKSDSTSSSSEKNKKGSDKEDSGYGDKQRKPGEAAKSAHSEWEKSGAPSAHEEKLEDTGFDMSKRTKPSGDE
ncbi:hypothetical protein L7F22_060213 [Adiantum nelumboides]|nr:hypothetical protein [Adiantum nelumboides]